MDIHARARQGSTGSDGSDRLGLLVVEARGRDEATIRMRRRQSGLPAGKTFDAWDEHASPIPKPAQRALRSLEWIERAEAGRERGCG